MKICFTGLQLVNLRCCVLLWRLARKISSNAVIGAGVVSVQNVLQGNGRQRLAKTFVDLDPDFAGNAVVRTMSRAGNAIHNGNPTFHCFDDLQQGNIFGHFTNAIPAARPADGPNELRFDQLEDEAADVFLRKFLSFADIADGAWLVAVVAGQIQHDAQSVASFCRNFHKGRVALFWRTFFHLPHFLFRPRFMQTINVPAGADKKNVPARKNRRERRAVFFNEEKFRVRTKLCREGLRESRSPCCRKRNSTSRSAPRSAGRRSRECGRRREFPLGVAKRRSWRL